MSSQPSRKKDQPMQSKRTTVYYDIVVKSNFLHEEHSDVLMTFSCLCDSGSGDDVPKCVSWRPELMGWHRTRIRYTMHESAVCLNDPNPPPGTCFPTATHVLCRVRGQVQSRWDRKPALHSSFKQSVHAQGAGTVVVLAYSSMYEVRPRDR